jgi:hypothetical protein
MAALVAAIHVLPVSKKEDVDARLKAGHDGMRIRGRLLAQLPSLLNAAAATFSGVMPKWR